MKKILVIKLGAMGDVVRTLPLLLGIKEKYSDSEISWITKKESKDLVKSSPYVKKVYTLHEEFPNNFDVLYNFDVENEAIDLVGKIKADEKYGFYSEDGFVLAFNIGASYYLNTLFDDATKKENTKTYQEMMFSAAELVYKRQHHPIYFSKGDLDYAENFFKDKSGKIIGIHLGAGQRWPSKVWHKDCLIEFIEMAKAKNYGIMIFGGPNEIKEMESIKKELQKKQMPVYFNNPEGSIMEFASLVNKCDFMVCSDSLSLHISLALKKPTAGLFFCTSPNEVEDYGVLKKMVSKKIYDFFPERMNEYDKDLVKSISPSDVLSSIINMDNNNK